VRAFFENQEDKGRLEALSTLFFPTFRALVHTYDNATVRAAFLRHSPHLEKESVHVWALWAYAAPEVMAERVIASALKSPFEASLTSGVLAGAMREALENEDVFFFNGLQKARVDGHSLALVRPLLCQNSGGWQENYRLLDRHEGFYAWRHSHDPWAQKEGLSRFAGSFLREPDHPHPPFTRAFLYVERSPSMTKAFDDPVFLKALESTPFWRALESTPNRHPEWEALLERQMLSGLLGKAGVDREYAPPLNTG
jgi:hypothetical protein